MIRRLRLPTARTTFCAIIFSTALCSTVTTLADALTITVAGIATGEGQIMLAVQSSEAAFNGDAPTIASFILPAREGQVTITTDALTAGEYGVRAMHDANANGEMDSNMLGIPKEAWGFSNNAKGKFGPPGWDAVKFQYSGDQSITINLNN
jgi:uncharacterized protein (DUF2141 family)